MRAVPAAVLVVLLVSAGRPAPGQAPVARDSAVYRTVLDSLYPRPWHYIVREFYRPVTTVDARGRFGFGTEPAIPESLQARLALVLQRTGGTLADVIKEWPGARWIDSNEVVLISRNDGGVIRFAVHLSRIAYSGDGRVAVLYVRMECGALCGSERVALVALSADDRWHVTRIESVASF